MDCYSRNSSGFRHLGKFNRIGMPVIKPLPELDRDRNFHRAHNCLQDFFRKIRLEHESAAIAGFDDLPYRAAHIDIQHIGT